MTNILILLITFIGAFFFILAPGSYWTVGWLIFLLAWLGFLLFIAPKKPAQSRGGWAFIAWFMLSGAVFTAVTMLYLAANEEIVIEFSSSSALAPIAYALERLTALVVGIIISIVTTLLFFFVVGYFSSIYVVGLHEDHSFWQAFMSFVQLIFNIQLRWLKIEDGEIKVIKEEGLEIEGLSLGRLTIRAGNAAILEKGGKITRICGPGRVIIGKGERIRKHFDLRRQFKVDMVKNVITADKIPLDIEIGISYQLKRAADPNAAGVLKEETFGLYAVDTDTLLKAAFSGTGFGWLGVATAGPVSALRDQIMTLKLEEIFDLTAGSVGPSARRVAQIETEIRDSVNGFAGNLGAEVLSIDIREIHLPMGVKEAWETQIKAQAEAEAITAIEGRRNTVRGQTVSSILQAITNGTGRPISESDLELATLFAQISKRALTDDVLGHKYMEMLQKMAEAEGTKIFTTPNSQ